jgi:hypothetical protein
VFVHQVRRSTVVGRYRVAMGLLITIVSVLAFDLAHTDAAQAASARWFITPTPGGPHPFFGVSCISSTRCVAVGSATNRTGIQQTLVELWNGTKWSVAPSPNQGSGVNALYGVSCIGLTKCVAVGTYYANPTTDQTLVESWNGHAWSITPSPNQGSGGNLLVGVSCTSSTDCVAAGEYGNASNIQQTLVESWNGTAWSITPSPDQGSGSNNLNGVSCTGPTSCVAVGDYSGNPIPTLNLVESWNGTAWSITPSPDPAGAVNALFGVWCTSSTNCMAVGFSKPSVPVLSESVSQNLVESWNGTAWSITPSPDQGSAANNLNGLSCSSSTNCVAVGLYIIPSGSMPQNLVESWNGSAWSITPSPNQGGGNAGLLSVSCTSSTNCVAVGKTQTLVDRRPRPRTKPKSR